MARASIASALVLWLLVAAATARGEPLPDARVAGALDALLGESGNAAREAIEEIVAAGDTRFVAVFIELLRAADVGIAAPAARVGSAGALGALTGRSHGSDWRSWVAWYAGTDLAPPPGFTGWKGRLLGRIDPAFAELLRPGAKSAIRVEEVVWGGVPHEGIPALDTPRMLAAHEVDSLDPDEPVFGIALAGEARAYPLRILDWHEMANDVIGGLPVSLAYCTLCGAGIAYLGRVGSQAEERALDFGSSGLLMRSNKLMVDRQTRSLWNQFTGRPVLGPLVGTGIVLERLPAVVTRWGDWRERHPATRVLTEDTGFDRPYRPGAPYGAYFASPDTMFPVETSDARLAPKARVFGVDVGGARRAYPLDRLLAERIIHDRVGGVDLILLAAGTPITVRGTDLRGPRPRPVRYEAGAPVRAYRSEGLRLRLDPDGSLRDADGARWSQEEAALVGAGGRRLTREPGVLSFWFAWQAFHPDTSLHGSRASTP